MKVLEHSPKYNKQWQKETLDPADEILSCELSLARGQAVESTNVGNAEEVLASACKCVKRAGGKKKKRIGCRSPWAEASRSQLRRQHELSIVLRKNAERV